MHVIFVCNSIFYKTLSSTTNEIVNLEENAALSVVVEYRTRNFQVAVRISPGSLATNLEQVDKLLCAQANSASYPRRDGKRVVAYGYGPRYGVKA